MNTESKTMPFLDIRGLEFSYGEVKVLHGLNIEIQERSITCVMGRNGVGKTTPYEKSCRFGKTICRHHSLSGRHHSDRRIFRTGIIPFRICASGQTDFSPVNCGGKFIGGTLCIV